MAELAVTAKFVLPVLRLTLSIIPKGPFPKEVDENLKDSEGLDDVEENPSTDDSFDDDDEYWVDIFTSNYRVFHFFIIIFLAISQLLILMAKMIKWQGKTSKERRKRATGKCLNSRVKEMIKRIIALSVSSENLLPTRREVSNFVLWNLLLRVNGKPHFQQMRLVK